MHKKKSQDSAIEPELRGQTPRRVRYDPSTQIARWILLVVFVGGLGVVIWRASLDLGDLAALRTRGATVMADVTDTYTSSGRSTTYHVEYTFTANGVNVSDDDDVRYTIYSRAKRGHPLLVTYLPSHPETHRVGTVDEARIVDQGRWWALLLLITLLLLGSWFLFHDQNYRSRLKLLKDGVPVTGEVTDRDIFTNRGDKYYNISYQFPSPTGTRTNRTRVPQEIYDACDPGLTLTVLYDPTRPSNNRPYLVLTDDGVLIQSS
ncbi:MAG: DUF3592 domain-containing protein [Armatimonadota bacterium]|nr:DUF3592 domain-containing protein [Armatimonadota bacterium]